MNDGMLNLMGGSLTPVPAGLSYFRASGSPSDLHLWPFLELGTPITAPLTLSLPGRETGFFP